MGLVQLLMQQKRVALFFSIGAKSPKIIDFGGKFQSYVDFALVDEIDRNRCQNEALGLNFRKKFEIRFFMVFGTQNSTFKVPHIQNIDFSCFYSFFNLYNIEKYTFSPKFENQKNFSKRTLTMLQIVFGAHFTSILNIIQNKS